MSLRTQKVAQLRQTLAAPGCTVMPCCFDALSAKLIEQAGYPITFMSGFAVSAARLALPDTGLIGYSEMVDQGRQICSAISIPVFGDGDTGYGNALNVQRTVRGYIDAGFAGIMLEDQLSPKRCGHTEGKQVVDRATALRRMAAAVEARDQAREQGDDLVIIARTDARATHGLDEALERACRFAEMGADVCFVEAPESIEEMRSVCQQVPGYKMANLVEHGKTPVLPPEQLAEIGYHVAAYPLTLLSSAIRAMQQALAQLQQGQSDVMDFAELQQVVGFPEYDANIARLEANSLLDSK